MPDPPRSLTLVSRRPGRNGPRLAAPAIGWDADGRMQMGPPILQFTLDQLYDDDHVPADR